MKGIDAVRKNKKKSALTKIEETVVRYGQIFGAEKLVDITAPAHLVMSAGVGVLTPFYDMLDEIISEGHRIDFPFTVNPRPCEKTINSFKLHERIVNRILFSRQNDLEEKLISLGIKDQNSFTCASYLPEVGNIPVQGDILAWAESSAVVYANSVLGARTNRNSGGIDILCNVLGKTPYFGLLTDKGRQADFEIILKCNRLPDPQVLGSFIGITVQDKVPYITGLEFFLREMNYLDQLDYLKDMGAASAATGAVGLYHVHEITPEALDKGRSLINNDFKKIEVTENDLSEMIHSFPAQYDPSLKKPQICFIGCPHLSYNQTIEWTESLFTALDSNNRKKTSARVFLSTAPDVIKKIQQEHKDLLTVSEQRNIFINSFCPLAISNNPFITAKKIMTNSGKLRNYTSAFFLEKDELIKLITGY